MTVLSATNVAFTVADRKTDESVPSYLLPMQPSSLITICPSHFIHTLQLRRR